MRKPWLWCILAGPAVAGPACASAEARLEARDTAFMSRLHPLLHVPGAIRGGSGTLLPSPLARPQPLTALGRSPPAIPSPLRRRVAPSCGVTLQAIARRNSNRPAEDYLIRETTGGSQHSTCPRQEAPIRSDSLPADEVVTMTVHRNTLAAVLLFLLSACFTSAAFAAPDYRVDVSYCGMGSRDVPAGETFQINLTTRNYGDSAAAEASTTSIYLSVDWETTTSDWNIFDVTVPALGPDESDSYTCIDVTVPPDTPPGDYVLGAICDRTDIIAEGDETNNADSWGEMDVMPSADLVVSVLARCDSGTVTAGDTFELSFTTENQGIGDVTVDTTTRIFLTRVSGIPSTSCTIHDQVVPPLAAGEADIRECVTVTVPASLSGTDYFINALANPLYEVLESDWTNNERADGTITVQGRPNYRFASLHREDSGSVRPSESIRVSFGVYNSGSGHAVSDSTTSVYLSEDDIITTSDLLLENIPTPPLPAGDYHWVHNRPVSVPPDTPAGTYYLGGIVDRSDDIAEGVETDNTRTDGTVEVLLPLDYVVTAFSRCDSGAVRAGESIQVSVATRNEGPGDALPTETSSTAIYFSEDAVITTSDISLRTLGVSPLAAETTENHDCVTVEIAESFSPGTYYLGAICDRGNHLGESDEANNTLADGTVTVTPAAPDYVISDVSRRGSGEVPAGGSIEVRLELRNASWYGDAHDTSTAAVFLSADTTITTSDIRIGDFAVPALSHLHDHYIPYSDVIIPGGTPPGSYYLGAIADVNDDVEESREDNNTGVGGSVAVVSPPDYVVTALSRCDSGEVEAGQSIQVTVTTRNEGPGDAPSIGTSVTGIFLSEDDIITTSDIFLGRLGVSPLLAGAAETHECVTIATPQYLSAGTYYLGAICDGNGQLVEADETNNTLADGTVTVTPQLPDFVITDLARCDSGQREPGQHIQVTLTIANQGTAHAEPCDISVYLSADDIIDASDTVIHETGIYDLFPGLSYTFPCSNMQIPGGTPAGTYYIGAIADVNDEWEESNEDNNTFVDGTVEVVTSPDYVVMSLSTCGGMTVCLCRPSRPARATPSPVAQ